MAAEDLINRLREEAFLAGRYHQAIKDDPSVAPGFGRLRDKHARAADQIADDLRSKSGGPADEVR